MIKLKRTVVEALESKDLLKNKDREMLKVLVSHLESAASLNEALTQISEGSKQSGEMLSAVLAAHVKSIEGVTLALAEIKAESKQNMEIVAKPQPVKVKVIRDKNQLIKEMVVVPADESLEKSAAEKMFGSE